MLRAISERITAKICSGDSSKNDIVAYGCEVFLSTVISILLLLILANLLLCTYYMITFILFFGVLRLSAGGYHAKNHLLCFCSYFITSYILISIAKQIPQIIVPYFILLCGIISIIVVYIFAPADCENRPIKGNEIVIYKKRSRYTIWVLLAFIVSLSWTSHWHYSSVAMFAVLAESLTLIKIRAKESLNDEIVEKN